jgi:hypothetical protein
MPSSIFTPRFQQLVRRAFNLVGFSGLQVDDTVLPVANLWDPAAPELYAVRGDRLAWGSASQAGTAALFPEIDLQNPVGSGVLLVCTQITLDIQGTSGPVTTGLIGSLPGTSANAEQLADGRFRGAILTATSAPTGQVSPNQVGSGHVPRGVTIDVVGQASPAFSAPVILPVRAVVAPGMSLAVVDQAVAAVTNVLRVSFFWYERNVEPTELTVSG